MRAKLQVVSGAKNTNVVLRLPTVIGRGGTAKLKLPASTVSRHHCELYEYQGQIVVRDLGSSNGTVVNGHKIQAPTFLTPEDELTIGPVTVRLTVATENAAQPASPTSAATEVDEALPDLQNLPEADKQQPLTAEVASDDAEPSKEASEDSVLEYAEPKSSRPSFVGIMPSEGNANDPVTEAPILEGVEQRKPDVSADDSALNNFFKNL